MTWHNFQIWFFSKKWKVIKRSNHFEKKSKFLQEAFQKTTDKIVELRKKPTQAGTVFEEKILGFFRNPKYSVVEKLESFVIHALKDIRIKLNKSQIVAWLGKYGGP